VYIFGKFLQKYSIDIQPIFLLIKVGIISGIIEEGV
jgi:hypothetical protein